MIALLSSTFGLSALMARVAATGGLVALLLGAWLTVALHYEHKGASGVLAKIEQRTTQNVDKATAARKSVENIPASQLNDAYRRD